MTTIASSQGTHAPRTALVTGAARRLGREIALGLARAGWDIAVHYGRSRDDALRTVDEIASTGRRAAALQADLADEAAVSDLIARATDAFVAASCPIGSVPLPQRQNATRSWSRGITPAKSGPRPGKRAIDSMGTSGSS